MSVGLVYRDAEFAHSNVCCHCPECGEYHCVAGLGVRIGHEGRRCSVGHHHCTMERISGQSLALYEILWQGCEETEEPEFLASNSQ